MSKTWGQSGSRVDRGQIRKGGRRNNGKGIRLVVSSYYDSLKKRIRFTKVYTRYQVTPDGRVITHYDYK